MKNKICEMKIKLDVITSKLDIAEEISRLVNIAKYAIQNALWEIKMTEK